MATGAEPGRGGRLLPALRRPEERRGRGAGRAAPSGAGAAGRPGRGPGAVTALLALGAEKAHAIASATYRRAAGAIGLLIPELTDRAPAGGGATPPVAATSTTPQTARATGGHGRDDEPGGRRRGRIGERHQVVPGPGMATRWMIPSRVTATVDAGRPAADPGRGQVPDGGLPARGSTPRCARGRPAAVACTAMLLAAARPRGRRSTPCVPDAGPRPPAGASSQAHPRASVLWKTPKGPSAPGEHPVRLGHRRTACGRRGPTSPASAVRAVGTPTDSRARRSGLDHHPAGHGPGSGSDHLGRCGWRRRAGAVDVGGREPLQPPGGGQHADPEAAGVPPGRRGTDQLPHGEQPTEVPAVDGPPATAERPVRRRVGPSW